MKLKILIYQSGKSQWEICRELQWSEAKLSRFVTGRRTPSQDDLRALARVLKVSIRKLQDALDMRIGGKGRSR